ncbi:hypothetical protein JHK87_004297 [Glycine soja]|nr:hypothetical protein JHK87_004297 [Glycine soja]
MVSEGVHTIERRLGQPYLGFGVLMRLSLSRTAAASEDPGQCGNALKGFEAFLSSSKNTALRRSGLSKSWVTYQRVWLGLAFFFVEQLSNSSSLPIFTPASDLFKVSVMSEC